MSSHAHFKRKAQPWLHVYLWMTSIVQRQQKLNLCHPPLPDFSSPSTQNKGRKRVWNIRYTHEDTDAHSTDKIWWKSNFEDDTRNSRQVWETLWPRGLLFIFSPKWKQMPEALQRTPLSRVSLSFSTFMLVIWSSLFPVEQCQERHQVLENHLRVQQYEIVYEIYVLPSTH